LYSCGSGIGRQRHKLFQERFFHCPEC
jgi:hypothetical protein